MIDRIAEFLFHGFETNNQVYTNDNWSLYAALMSLQTHSASIYRSSK